MPNRVPAHYHDAEGVDHDVVARKARDGAWQVLDVSARKSTLVETLTAWTTDATRPRRSRESTRARSAAGTTGHSRQPRVTEVTRRPPAAARRRRPAARRLDSHTRQWARAPLRGARGPAVLNGRFQPHPTKEVSS